MTGFSYYYNGTDGVILYGEGIHYVVLCEDEYAAPWDGSYLVATNDGAVDIASLPTKDDDGNALTYYVFDGQDFVKATSGTVAKNECYLVLSADDYPQSDKILVANSEEVGITDVATKPAPQFQGIYTIDGKQVTAPVKGSINVIGNRKVWINK